MGLAKRATGYGFFMEKMDVLETSFRADTHRHKHKKCFFDNAWTNLSIQHAHTHKQINKKRATKGRGCKVIGPGDQSSNPKRSVDRPSPLFYWMQVSLVGRPSPPPPLFLSVVCSIEH